MLSPIKRSVCSDPFPPTSSPITLDSAHCLRNEWQVGGACLEDSYSEKDQVLPDLTAKNECFWIGSTAHLPFCSLDLLICDVWSGAVKRAGNPSFVKYWAVKLREYSHLIITSIVLRPLLTSIIFSLNPLSTPTWYLFRWLLCVPFVNLPPHSLYISVEDAARYVLFTFWNSTVSPGMRGLLPSDSRPGPQIRMCSRGAVWDPF